MRWNTRFLLVGGRTLTANSRNLLFTPSSSRWKLCTKWFFLSQIKIFLIILHHIHFPRSRILGIHSGKYAKVVLSRLAPKIHILFMSHARKISHHFLLVPIHIRHDHVNPTKRVVCCVTGTCRIAMNHKDSRDTSCGRPRVSLCCLWIQITHRKAH